MTKQETETFADELSDEALDRLERPIFFYCGDVPSPFTWGAALVEE